MLYGFLLLSDAFNLGIVLEVVMNSVLLVSLDFELFWGMQDCHSLESYKENIMGGRKAIPRLLELFQKYGIHATWATVGMMFAEGVKDVKSFLPNEKDWPTYEKNALLSYRCLTDGTGDEKELPWLFAPSLIRMISDCEGMEIGSHTFSHYYCREQGQTTEQFAADMRAAQNIATEKGYHVSSVVLPRNQCEPEYTKMLGRLGFTAYRDEENDWIHEKIKIRPLMRALRLMDVYFPLTGYGGYIPKKEFNVWNFTGSRMYKPFFKPLSFMENLKVLRIKKQMLHAAKNGLVFHLWWHPHNIGVKTDYHLQQLDEIFAYYQVLKEKYGMLSLNMGEAVAYFDDATQE